MCNINSDNLRYIGKKIFFFESIDSTNKEAKRNLNSPDGSVFIAEHQTEGRGRMGREWISQKNSGIWMSILLRPEISLERFSGITIAVGLAVCEALREKGIDSYIKWPNDIIVNKKKICGILTETVLDQKNNTCIVGIGLNVNTKLFDSELEDKATSLYMETGTEYDKCRLIEGLLLYIERTLDHFYEYGMSGIIDDYKKMCITLNSEIKVLNGEEEYIAFAEGVTENGELIIKRDGEVSVINSGDVSVRGILGYVK